ncbi:MAG: hypothetical protein PHO08_04465 [Methylococcales bacterium]|nr:hypothetical protein [Methylococcales bacterium]MDD5632356.1 hypothetical protein [Methylococcales bacterium]
MRLDEIIQQHTKELSPAQQAEVFDFVLFLEQKEQKQANKLLMTDQLQRKEQLKKALDDAVAMGVFEGVDGAAWQKEQRQDRNIGYDE